MANIATALRRAGAMSMVRALQCYVCGAEGRHGYGGFLGCALVMLLRQFVGRHKLFNDRVLGQASFDVRSTFQ